MSNRPNVIFILTDDQGYGDVSRLGNPVIQTPTLDRLHDESVRFTDFHVCPVCTPTRGELLTGRDALRNGATFVCMGRSLMRADLPTMADIFAENGYHTGHFGKWHLGDNYPYRPQDRGFHETIWHPGWGITSAPDYFENDYFDDHYRHKDDIEQFKGYCTDVWFEQATKWIDRNVKSGDPFLAYIATNAPHGPLWVPDHYRQPYLGRVERPQASFFGMINCIEENMDRLDRYMRQTGLYENTILIFMTDNGTASGEGVFNAGMRGKKASVYDGGHRVPFFIRWPEGGVGGDTGRDIAGVTRSTDVLPTLINLCGLKVENGLEFDGVSLGGLIHGEKDQPPDRKTVIQYGHTNPHISFGLSGKNVAAVLWNNWRLVNGTELYDINADAGQKHDMAAAHPDVVSAMQDHYEEWWSDVADTFDTYQPLVVGTDQENPMRLSSPDWAWVYADNQGGIRGPVMDSGTWHVEVAKAGSYRMALRRWPEESGLGISSPAPAMQGVDGGWPAGIAIGAASAWLQAGRNEQTQELAEGAEEITFQMDLEKGPTQIKSWWRDNKGNQLAGAYYLTVKREEK